jgi:hypothetical protein
MIKNKKGIKYKLYSYIYITVFFISPLMSFAQFKVKTDTTKIRIGEQIKYEIITDKNVQVQFPKLILDSLKHLEVVKSDKIDTLKNKLVKKYFITSFDSGRYQIPEQIIRINNKTHKTKPIWVDVSTVAVDTIKQPLFPIKAVHHEKITLKDYAINYWYLLFGLFWLILIWYIFFRKKETKEEKFARLLAKLPPFEIAKRQLQKLDKKQLWQNNKTKEYYSELTDILRNYIERELKIPAMESTTKELIDALQNKEIMSKLEMPKETLTRLESLLKDADLVKFAKMKPIYDEILTHRKEADQILIGLKPKTIEENEVDNDKVEHHNKKENDDK